MPTVSVTETIEAPIEEVWKVVCDVERYPEIMECVREVKIIEEGPDWSVTVWSVDLKGSILSWTEHESRDAARFRVDYHQKEGDLESFEGFWQFERQGPRLTRASLEIAFEIGIPMLREMLDPVASRAIQDNARAMLRSLGPTS